MKTLYEIEHKFLPMFILGSEEKVPNGICIALSNFSSLCMTMAESISKKNNPVEFLIIKAMEDDFKIKELPGKVVNGVKYNFLKLYFYFAKTPEFSPLCPHAYVVFYNVNGKNVYHYFTIEFDSMTDDEDGRGSFWLCGWDMDSARNLKHNNYGMIKLDDEVEINTILDKVIVKKNSNFDSSVRVSKVSPECVNYIKEQKEKEYDRQRMLDKIGIFTGICFVLFIIYSFCK